MTKASTVILAAGDFPRRGSPAWEILERAKRVICCDHAADTYRRRFHREPTVVVGDGDSCRGEFLRFERIAEQETNDLEKAIRYVAARKWPKPVLLGLTGRREDHTLGNVFRAWEHGLEAVTDYGRFLPVRGRKVLHLAKGSPVSVFATDPRTVMTSRGLVWPLDGVKFSNLYCATLNRASAATVRLTSTHLVYVYIPITKCCTGCPGRLR